MALEHVVAIGLLVFLNWKIIRNHEYFNERLAKWSIDLATMILGFFGVFSSLIGALDSLMEVALIAGIEVFFLVLAIIIQMIKNARKTILGANDIKPVNL